MGAFYMDLNELKYTVHNCVVTLWVECVSFKNSKSVNTTVMQM